MEENNHTTHSRGSEISSEYIVEERDTIPDIEKKLGFSWEEIREANKELIGNYDKIHSGLKLKLPNKKQ
ncbi:MAG: LysM peptidoglycan-binding domain-containing protein [Bacteroidota bacterium]|nr:LysM peptidoglycan-binding domain-containing protein [Flavisolibacter sp.]MBD0287318.1 LysM peptidoglycan-binding domain-containing protein [Flavisolibacter sp.]MBD0296004.1 LysM peptidoglycan-binding domain-containing protein [Flavisolibacter sp.]MDQ3842893.1 LysM peptidoglycan-binding domain-containing protein [Bacteroidota bacterium]